MKKNYLYVLLLVIITISCKSEKTPEEETEAPEVITPVTVTSLSTDAMTEYIELNATSTFLQQAYIKANASGYVTDINVHINKMITSGQNAFTLKTKEAQSIGNTINLLDTSFKFSGVINIKAGTSGYVSEINHQLGEYVQEGEQLAAISDIRSFVFILNLPYELRPFVLNKKNVELLLPDGQTLVGNITSVMPTVDSVSQTQNVVISVKEKNLPANLIAKVKVIKTAKSNTASLPKQAVLSDETQNDFWVMKVMDSATAVKVPVTKGIETNDRIEILTPKFLNTDKFILTGNYGLPDTARIKIIQQ
jgi:multidrug efflux pump subunit AcrA (membrane-fusion protein)